MWERGNWLLHLISYGNHWDPLTALAAHHLFFHQYFSNKAACSNNPSPLFSLKYLQSLGPSSLGREIPSAQLLVVLLSLSQDKSLQFSLSRGFHKE